MSRSRHKDSAEMFKRAGKAEEAYRPEEVIKLRQADLRLSTCPGNTFSNLVNVFLS